MIKVKGEFPMSEELVYCALLSARTHNEAVDHFINEALKMAEQENLPEKAIESMRATFSYIRESLEKAEEMMHDMAKDELEKLGCTYEEIE